MAKAIDPGTHLQFKKNIAHQIQTHQAEIKSWYRSIAHEAPPPLYCSVDLRDSGHKIVPVDSNLFPAGFNNICPDDQRTSPPIFKKELDLQAKSLGLPPPKKILIIPEFHTFNAYYIENLFYLNALVEQAGYQTKISWISDPPLTQPQELISITQKKMLAHPLLLKENGELHFNDGFAPDLILLNNDFSGGYPPLLDQIKLPILPSYHLGWHSRKKSTHFKHYNHLATQFSELIGIDPWTFRIETEEVDHVDFGKGENLDKIIQVTDQILAHTQTEFKKRKINEKPFVFIKNNSGTYGMGIMVVHSSDELKNMNRRTKNKMSVGKNKRSIHSIIVQEGIPTTTLVGRLASEPVIYLVGCELIGGFLRSNPERGIEDNLNSKGMVFRKLCMSDLREDPDDLVPEDEPILELVYGSVARLSALATGLELKERMS